MSFMKRGAASQKAIQQAKAKQEAQEAANSKDKAYRFYLPPNHETSITFLDGSMTKDGVLDIPTFNEHQLHLNGHWKNWFVCTEQTEESEPCPICEGGDIPSLVGVLTVIDHSEWKDKHDKVHKDERKLFVAKFGTLQKLQALGIKRKGLAGWTVDVLRGGDKKSPSVGDTFDFQEKHTGQGLINKYGEEVATPFDYEKVIPYLNAEKLRALGFGSTVVGNEQPLPDAGTVPEDQVGDEI